MRNIIVLLFIGSLISLSSCRSDFDFVTSGKNDLRFSKDTIYLDTVFTNIGSSTYTLKVYNKSNKDISIPTIQLGKGLDSKYRMTVDGMQGTNGKIFNNVELLAKDSLYIFVETTASIADANPTDFLYTDQITFGTPVNFQKVELVTLIQDAYFIFPKKENGVYEGVPIGVNEDATVALIQGRDLVANHPDNGDEFNFKTDKPYVVYGYASVPDGKTLTIPAGARVHFHADSGLLVQSGGTLHIEGNASADGETTNEVIFEGDRLEPDYSDVSGQWGFVFLRQGSIAEINHLTLKNAIVGLLVENNAGGAMKISNTQIYDCSNVGLLARAANIEGSNIVINNSGQFNVACTFGGTYNFTHCTFNNNWPSSSQGAVLAQNYLKDSAGEISVYQMDAQFNNSILYGSNQVELYLDFAKDSNPTYKFTNCLVKCSNISNSITNNPFYDFTNTDRFSGNLIHTGATAARFLPDFLDVNKNQLNIGQDSAAKEKADPVFSALYPLDLNNKPRPTSPATNSDIGAYQSITFEN